MAIKFQYNKTSLQQLEKQLKMRERSLPTIKSKESALRIEVKRTKDEVGISSLRMGNVVGIHEVHVCTPSQTITLRHEVATRNMLAEGGVEAARFMVGKPKGMYRMENLLADG